ncbi:hypothetical protein ACFYUK_42590 [Nonomuraea wenchangensis]
MPSRSRVLLAKASVLAGIAVAASLLIAIPGYLDGRAVAAGFRPTLPPAGAWTVIGGGTLMLVVVMVLVPFAVLGAWAVVPLLIAALANRRVL